jgi:hypothetical protein
MMFREFFLPRALQAPPMSLRCVPLQGQTQKYRPISVWTHRFLTPGREISGSLDRSAGASAERADLV